MTTDTIYSRSIDSPVGTLTAVATDQGLRAVLWPDDERVGFESDPVESPDHPVLEAVVRYRLGSPARKSKAKRCGPRRDAYAAGLPAPGMSVGPPRTED